jgi:4-amino-4-deoxy-L-arabinose transferase-like glycosyltransferase
MNTSTASEAAGLAWARDGETVLSVNMQIVLVLLAHVMLWTWVGVSSRSNFDVPGDMVEAYAWAQGWQWGYYKHPPLSAWIAGLWFSVVPESHLGYSLLAAVNGAVGMAGLAVLARQFLPGRWVLLCVATASLTPGVTSLAMRFNANSILISSWPWAMALFVLLMKSNRRRDAVLCGAVCALAVLGKYYSGVLLLTLLACSLLVPAWRSRWATAGPWLASITFVALLTPHLLWLLEQTQGPLQYAAHATTAEHPGTLLMRAVSFALAQWVFPALAFVVFWLALQGPRRNAGWWRAATSLLRPRWDAAWLLGVTPIIATMLGTMLTGARTSAVWGLPIAAGLMLLAASRAREAGADVNVGRLWRTLISLWLVVAVLAPLWWLWRAQLATPGVAEPRQELAQTLDLSWLAEFGQPLPWVTGTRALAASTSFYTAGSARYWSLWSPAIETPWVDTGEVLEDGGLIVCDRGDAACLTAAERWSAERRTVTVAKRERGFSFAPVSYEVFVIRPRITPASSAAGTAAGAANS